MWSKLLFFEKLLTKTVAGKFKFFETFQKAKMRIILKFKNKKTNAYRSFLSKNLEIVGKFFVFYPNLFLFFTNNLNQEKYDCSRKQ
jgi:hypothetical protein